MQELVRTPLTVIHVIACAFLILIVLLQPGKSGGMGIFSSPAATQVFGGRGAGNLLTKVTWVTTAIFFFSSITLAYMSTSADDALKEKAEAVAEPAPTPAPAATAPAPPPAEPAPAEPTPAPAEPAPADSH